MYLWRGSQKYSNIPHACLWVFQVWLLSKEEPSNRYPGLAVTLGDCDWLLFLLLWGGASEPHWRPPAVASHCSGWHHPFPTGQCWKDLCFPHVTALCSLTIRHHPNYTKQPFFLVLNGSFQLLHLRYATAVYLVQYIFKAVTALTCSKSLLTFIMCAGWF